MKLFDYDSAWLAADYIGEKMRNKGMEPDDVKVHLILGSGLNGFANRRMNAEKAGENSGPLVIPFSEILGQIGAPIYEGGVKGHAKRLVIGPVEGMPDNVLTVGQQGREHAYEEGISTRRATFWLRVSQILGTQLLVGSNAAGVVTPDTVKVPTLMLVNSDIDDCDDNPLVGDNDEHFGPRFPDMDDAYTHRLRVIAREIAAELKITLGEGTYIRQKGPNYESKDTIYRLRATLKDMWREGNLQQGERRFRGAPVGVVGMSSTYEMLVAMHAARSKRNPAFTKGISYISAVTNYAAGLGPNGFLPPPNHKEVEENAALVQDWFEELVCRLIQRSV